MRAFLASCVVLTVQLLYPDKFIHTAAIPSPHGSGMHYCDDSGCSCTDVYEATNNEEADMGRL